MDKQLYSAAVLIGLMIVISLIETVIPGKRDGRLRREHLVPNSFLTLTTISLNIALTTGAVMFALLIDVYSYSLISIEAPFWMVLAASIICLDFFAYAAHRLMHIIPWLWRAHQIHHSELLVDVTTAYRQHPVEAVWRFLFTIIPAWIFGIPAEAIVLYKSVSALFALMEHTNIELWRPLDKTFSTIFVTPNMHKVHHSRTAVETDSNFGNIISVFDRVLGTFTPSKPLGSIDYGLDEMDDPSSRSLPALLRRPFEN